jgi:ABC-2 type transport system ATP-binding protein
MKKNILHIDNVSKQYCEYGKLWYLKKFLAKTVFENLSINVEESTVLGVTGLNGSGKTTLLKMLACLYFPTRGQILIDGYDSITCRKILQANIGVNLNDERSFFWRLTGLENIQLISSINGINHDHKYYESIKNLSEMLELSKELSIPVQNYSRGMKEKLGYLISLVHPHKILIFDDFGKNLDYDLTTKLFNLIMRKINKGECKLIVISSPKVEIIKSLSTRCLVCENKKLKEL